MKKTKKKREFFRSVARGIENGALDVDRENKVIRNVSVLSTGEAEGHFLEIDETTIDQVVTLGKKSSRGIKSRFGHPNMSATALGTFLGRAKNFRKTDEGARARADLHLDETAFNTPNGDLANYVFDLAESDPDAFGMSIAWDGRREENGKDGLRDKDGDLLDLARVDKLWAVDAVDDPASGDGLFSNFLIDTNVQFSAETSAFLDQLFESEDALEKVDSFLDKYLKNEDQKKQLKRKAERVINLKRGGSDSVVLDADKNTGNNNSITLKFQLEEGSKMAKDKNISPDAGKDQGKTNPDQKQDGFTKAQKKELEEHAAAMERSRIEEITQTCTELNLDNEFSSGLIKDAIPIEEARTKMLEAAREKMKAVNTTIDVKNDARDKFRKGVSDSILVRSGLEKRPEIISDVNAGEFRSMSLQNLAKCCLMNDGVNGAYMFDGMQLWETLISRQYFAGAPAQGSGDFVNVLSNVLNKSVNMGWEQAASTYELWVGTGFLKDFKTNDLVRMTPYGDLQKVQEGQAPKMARMDDTKEQTRLETYASKYPLTREAMVNDDLSQFTTLPAKQMNALRRLMNQLCYNLIYDDNGAATAFTGPTMLEDNLQMFDVSTHQNLKLTGSGAITQNAMDEAFVNMMNQTAMSPDGGKSNAIRLNIGPAYCICGPKNNMAAYKLFNAIGYNVSTDDGAAEGTQAANIYGPGQPRNLRLIIDAELDNISASYYPWYLATNPMDVGHITLYTLTGQTTPYTAASPTPAGDFRGMIWEIWHDFVFAQTDWRGMYCNRGAAK